MKNQKDITDKKDGFHAYMIGNNIVSKEVYDDVIKAIQSAIHKTEERMIEEIEHHFTGMRMNSGLTEFALQIKDWEKLKKKLLNHSKQV